MGEKLLGEITEATGLPRDLVFAELSRLVKSAGLTPEQTTLEDLRQILADYLQDVILEAKEEFGEPEP